MTGHKLGSWRKCPQCTEMLLQHIKWMQVMNIDEDLIIAAKQDLVEIHRRRTRTQSLKEELHGKTLLN